jgi:hypothetical protein
MGALAKNHAKTSALPSPEPHHNKRVHFYARYVTFARYCYLFLLRQCPRRDFNAFLHFSHVNITPVAFRKRLLCDVYGTVNAVSSPHASGSPLMAS